jgi:TRAP-type mannitol/chloroaromatic compound transport system permease small subunit
VVLRYAFGEGRIEFEEIQWHLYSAGFLLGLGYALQCDAHIRVDVLHERFSPTLKAWVELYGIVLLLLPFIALVLYYSVPFVAASYRLSEISNAPGGLPYRWAIKAMLPVGFLLLLLAVLSRLSRVWRFLFPVEAHDAG